MRTYCLKTKGDETMKIKDKIKDFVINHPTATRAIAGGVLGAVAYGVYIGGAIAGVRIANNAMMEEAITTPGITVAEFLTNNGVIGNK